MESFSKRLMLKQDNLLQLSTLELSVFIFFGVQI
jgi:hypothetical protein